MEKPIMRIFIESHSKKTRLYWNRVLQSWVESPTSASPFGQEEFTRILPLNAQKEEYPEFKE